MGLLRSARNVAVAATLVAAASLVSFAPRALAFAPAATRVVAHSASAALPPAARWSTAWDDAAADAVTREALAESVDPETFAAEHRWDADRAALEGTSAPDLGDAPAALADAQRALRSAFAGGDAAGIAAAIARLSQAATDLADPFQTTSLTREEVPGARAFFDDLFASADVAGLTAAAPVTSGDGVADGISLAQESAARRPAIEDAARIRNDATVTVIRRDRLEAALSRVQGLTLAAWRAAGSPALDGFSPAAGRARVWPTPARAEANVAFTLPRAADVRVEVVDLAGRRVWSRAGMALGAGPQTLTLGARDLATLAPGVYLTHVTAPGYEATGRLVRIGR